MQGVPTPPPPIQGPPCPHCGYPVPGKPALCPTCGYRLVPKSPRKLISAILALVLCGGPSMFFGACFGAAAQQGHPGQDDSVVLGCFAIAGVLLLYTIYEFVMFLRQK